MMTAHCCNAYAHHPLHSLTHSALLARLAFHPDFFCFCKKISIARLFSPFFFISIVRCTYWSLLLRPLPRSSLYQKGYPTGVNHFS